MNGSSLEMMKGGGESREALKGCKKPAEISKRRNMTYRSIYRILTPSFKATKS